VARILVTGAAGFIGRSLCPALAMRGHSVIAATRSRVPLPPGIEPCSVGELLPQTEWSVVLHGVEVVVHLAARAHRRGPEAAFAREPMTAATLARAAARAGVHRLIHLSSILAMGESTTPGRPIRPDDAPHPTNAYGRAKLATEQALAGVAAESGLELAILRPPLVYGPGVGGNFRALIRLAASGMPLPFAAVDNRRSLIFIDNLVDLIAVAASHPAARDRVLLPRDSDELSTPNLIRRLAAAQGRRARLFAVPPSAFAALRPLPWLGSRLAPLTRSLQIDDAATRAALGWTPPIAAAQGLAATARASAR
jgi:UDP-N-acetyl-alpha-D-quinovosamine dehydrogenase